ncbi:ATM interactor-like [Megalops cyprinoides]|uniref:ATM interactor-like n=1 Tax=Megalops cyprinoides TaxID=118141 RepID=UPI001864799F|nr:ATM interactor-like [Megalops cyprinoides]
MAASASRSTGVQPYLNNICTGTNRQKDSEGPALQLQEMIKPSIMELTKEVRTNILCTVEGCGKILPNTPALNMHLVKSHRVKDGLVNPTVRKNMKGSKKLYCCPVEGCPRGPNRPFSQFSLVKQHFMKMHAEKKHKCVKCNNSYSTEWDLRRHTEDCGKTFHCTCGCPYASRAALLSHIYRTGHEVPTEHRYPPVKKRKMEGSLSGVARVQTNEQVYQVVNVEKELSEVLTSPDGACHSESGSQNSSSTKNIQKLLLPKPKIALVNVPVMQFTHVPVLLSSADSSTVRSVVLTVDNQGSVMSAVHLVPQSAGAVIPTLDTKTLCARDTMTASRLGLDLVSVGVQVNLESVICGGNNLASDTGDRSKSISTDIQTDITYLSKGPQSLTLCSPSESSVSSCSQTDISVSAQVLLPVSVETQTFPSQSKITSSISAQTDPFSQTYFSSYNITRETQTNASLSIDQAEMTRSIMCADLFSQNSLSVSSKTAMRGQRFQTNSMEDPLSRSDSCPYDHKSVGVIEFSAQADILQQNPVADNQTQTMSLFSDFENILSESMDSNSLDNHSTLSDATASCDTELTSVQEQTTGIDFDFEEFLNTVHIQTQTEESELRTLSSETHLESLDIETQTDFLFFNDPLPSDGNPKAHSNDLGLEMYDTQTQTDHNFLLDRSGHIPLGSFLKQSSFSLSTEASDMETQTDVQPIRKLSASSGQVKLSSAQTQTVTSYFQSLGNLFLTSNETQTAMDDFLNADLAWNMESHLSSVETQTCEELFSLFQHSERPSS